MHVPAKAMSEISYKRYKLRWLRIERLVRVNNRDEAMCRPVNTRRNVATNGLVLLNRHAQCHAVRTGKSV